MSDSSPRCKRKSSTIYPEGRFTVHKHAIIVPFQESGFACYEADGHLISEAMLNRSYGLPFKTAPFVSQAPRQKGSYIFGGFLFKHYGHFLLESLSRLWFARNYPEFPVFWVARDRDGLNFQLEIFSLLGLTNTMYCALTPKQCDRLIIPEPGFIVQEHFFPFHDAFLSVHNPAPIVAGRKIYLSRRRFSGESALTNEEELEALLVSRGFTICYPEEYPVQEQLDLLSSAEKILALEGSALHTLILLTHLESEIIIIPRPLADPNHNFTTIANRKGFRQTYLSSEGLYLATLPAHGTHVQHKGELNLERIRTILDLDDWSPTNILWHEHTCNEDRCPR